MDLDDLRAIIDQAKRSAFRLETLPQYLVPQEAERFARWRAGKELPARTPETTPYFATLQRDQARGFRWYRVHILDEPLCEYTRFELASYRESQSFGAEIYIAERAAHPDLDALREDFWLYDDKIAVRMIYDEEGHFLHPEQVDDAVPFLRARDTAIRHAEPLNDYLARRNPKLTI